MKNFFSLALILAISLGAQAQIRDIPKLVKDSFAARYPNADSVKYRDNLVDVYVTFYLNGEHHFAMFSNKGEWKQTEKDWSFDKLSPTIQDGFHKSKYATPDWKVKETSLIYLPAKPEEYRVKVEKNDLQKKYLYFDSTGRLLKDAVTL
jgi:hypothetical protein